MWYETCIFIKSSYNFITIIATNVDNFFTFSICNQDADLLKDQLSSRFKIKDLGKIKQCLGMHVKVENK